MPNAGFFEPSRFSKPLCHALVGSSRTMNQMNMSTRGSFAAMLIAVRQVGGLLAGVTPFGSPGFVS